MRYSVPTESFCMIFFEKKYFCVRYITAVERFSWKIVDPEISVHFFSYFFTSKSLKIIHVEFFKAIALLLSATLL